MGALVEEQLELLERIAVDHDQVGEGAGLDDAELALVAQDLGADGGGLADDLDRLQHLGAEHELAALLDLELAQKVAAVADLHAGLLADLERAQRAVEHDVVLGQHVGGHAELRGALLHDEVGHQVGHHVAVLGLQQLGRLGVDQVAVLDGAHAVVDGARDGFGRVGVGQHVAAEGLGLVGRRGDLGLGELQGIERIVGRGDAARAHDLHLVGALAHLLAHQLAHLVGAVGDRHAVDHGVAAAAGRAGDVGAAARIAVAAGRADGAAGDEEARAGDQAGLDGGLDAPVGAAGVAHRGEAAVDHALHQVGRPRRQQGQRHVLEVADVDLDQEDMDVAVDQARHQGALAAIDHLRLGRLDRLGRHFLDGVALDQDLVAAARLVPARVEQVQILEKYLRHQRSPNMRLRTLRWPPI